MKMTLAELPYAVQLVDMDSRIMLQRTMQMEQAVFAG
jgi:hypothetical protein